MEQTILTRKVWRPGEGEHVIEVEGCAGLVETANGKRKAVFIKLEGEPYVWLINHYDRTVEKAVETQLARILSKKKSDKALVKVTAYEECGRRLYDLEEFHADPESVVVSVGIYISDAECGEYYLIHSDLIPLGGEK